MSGVVRLGMPGTVCSYTYTYTYILAIAFISRFIYFQYNVLERSLAVEIKIA